jgi:DNA-directed RNA polymerase III subunit RPC1
VGFSDCIVLPKKNRIRVFANPIKSETPYQRLITLRRTLPQVIIKGVKSLSRAIIKNEKGVQQLLVEGYGLRDVMITEGMCLFRPVVLRSQVRIGVVGTRTTSNHTIEVQKVLGIEAARLSIVNEINYTMSSHDLNVDPRHMMLLGDIMCYKVWEVSHFRYIK